MNPHPLTPKCSLSHRVAKTAIDEMAARKHGITKSGQLVHLHPRQWRQPLQHQWQVTLRDEGQVVTKKRMALPQQMNMRTLRLHVCDVLAIPRTWDFRFYFGDDEDRLNACMSERMAFPVATFQARLL